MKLKYLALVTFVAAFAPVAGLPADVTGDRLNVGSSHVLSGTWATIGGGAYNTNDDQYCVIAGGYGNRIHNGGGNNAFNAILGGLYNSIQTSSYSSVISGGQYNEIGTNAHFGSINGGGNCKIGDNSRASWIGGGFFNYIEENTPYGSIGGGGGNLIEEHSDYSTIGGGLGNIIGSDSTGEYVIAFLGGGKANTISNDCTYAALVGGFQNLISTNCAFSFLGGGDDNCIRASSAYAVLGGGSFNTNAATCGTIGGGQQNLAMGLYSTIAGGYKNTNNGSYSTAIGGGSANFALADYSTIPGGKEATASHYGQLSYTSGKFATPGDGQHSMYVLRGKTTTATQGELFLDGDDNGGSARMTIPTDSTWVFDAQIVARRSDGAASAGYRIQGVIINSAGVVGILGAPVVTTLYEDTAGWDVAVTDVYDALSVIVTGSNGVSIRWVVTVQTTEVHY